MSLDDILDSICLACLDLLQMQIAVMVSTIIHFKI